MAINPPSDIVLDVARAADPDKYRAAVERLSRLRATTPTSETFMPPAAQPSAAASNTTAAAPDAATAASPLNMSAGGEPRRRLDPYGQFEAFVLQSFVQSMLPKDATNVFGSGSAGEFWRSMLAEKLGDELARSGQVGIAQRLAAGPSHPAQPTATQASAPPSHLMLAPSRMSVAAPNGEQTTDLGAGAPVPAAERS